MSMAVKHNVADYVNVECRPMLAMSVRANYSIFQLQDPLSKWSCTPEFSWFLLFASLICTRSNAQVGHGDIHSV